MLNLDQMARLENLQIKALKVIYGWNRSAASLMALSGLETLQERRESQFARFAKKCSSSAVFAKWFEPSRETGHDTRNKAKFHEPRARTERLKNSPKHAMIRLLNSENT